MLRARLAPKLRVSAFVSVGGLAEAKHFPFGLRHLDLKPKGSAQPPGTYHSSFVPHLLGNACGRISAQSWRQAMVLAG